jgi:hypothetical protein
LEQSTGRENESRESEPSAVPESVRAVHDEGHAGDPTFGDELPLSPAQSKSAGTIDLAIAADEPEQVIRYLIVAAQEWIDASENTEKWKAIIAQLAVLQKQLERLNAPASHRSAKPASS